MRRGVEPSVGLVSGIYWTVVYNPIKCYLKLNDITNIKEYRLEDFFVTYNR